MNRATTAYTSEAKAQARTLQRQVPTVSESLLAIEWVLAQNPLAGDQTGEPSSFAYERGPAPGSPGIRVTYRYNAGEVVIVAVELVG